MTRRQDMLLLAAVRAKNALGSGFWVCLIA